MKLHEANRVYVCVCARQSNKYKKKNGLQFDSTFNINHDNWANEFRATGQISSIDRNRTDTLVVTINALR